MSSVEKWLAESPFTRDLGVGWQDGGLALPFAASLTTGYGTLHGGAIAALAVVSAQAVMRSAEPAVRPRTVSLQVDYVRGGRGDAFRTTTSTIRRAHELGFYAVGLHNQDGVHIANASATLANGTHGEIIQPPVGSPPPPDPGATARSSPEAARSSPEGAPSSPEAAGFDTALQGLPFLADRGMHVKWADQGRLEMSLAPVPRNLAADGTIHEGAALTLLDVAGATVPWTLERSAGSGATITLHAHLHGRLPSGALLARSAVRARDDRISWSEISLVSADEGRLCGTGTVVYRFA